MPTKAKYIRVIDVWPQLQKLLNLPDMAINGGVSIHLKPGDIVRVDMLGVMPVNVADATTLTDTFAVSVASGLQVREEGHGAT